MLADRPFVLQTVLAALLADDDAGARQILQAQYPAVAAPVGSRRYAHEQMLRIFQRDGFVDRYSGARLVFPGTLRTLSKLLPDEFPFHPNWKVSATHPAYWHLCPTIDHVVPIAKGGNDEDDNLVTTSQLRNSAKAHWSLDELGWRLLPAGDLTNWDGLTGAFSKVVAQRPPLLNDNYMRAWHRALTPPERHVAGAGPPYLSPS